MDDRENNLILLKDLLAEDGYNVESAVNGKDALEKLHAGKVYDLIISDILMPVMDGFMLCENVKRDEKLRNVPFVFSSASFVGRKDEELALKLGAKKFIRKPYEPDEFLKIVQSLLKDVDDDKIETQEIFLEDDKEVHKLYNERLVEKLEKKVSALENEIAVRKRAEEALQENEYRFRRYFDLGLIGMATTSLEKGWVEYNDTLSNMFGYSRDDFARLTWTELTYPEDLPVELVQFNRVIAGEIDGYSMEKRFIHRDGSIFNAMISANALRKADGSVDYFVALIHDITERKRMEEALLKSEKLKSLGTLTAGVSHEINNILAIISGNVQLLMGTYKDHEKLTKALRTIMSAVDDGTQISSKMLKFTKIDNDAAGFVSFDVRDLIIQSIDFTSPRWKNEAQANGIDYQINKDGMKSVSSIMCNPSELREVFINIINNALDAMPDGGNLSFSTWSDGNTVFVSIADTGDGMSKETKKYMFDPFFTTKKALGTGLGMSLTYGIITRHGGTIGVESEVGNGTKFTLQFPTTNEIASLITTHVLEQESSEKKLCILVVDDEDNLCNVLDQFFSRSGNRVKTVNNGADAIDIVKTENFDLVLCDLAMPDTFGYDVIDAMNKLEKRPKIGVITGRGDEIKPTDEGMNVDFILKKPFNFTELTKQINGLKF